jgi:hypothetical protein
LHLCLFCLQNKTICTFILHQKNRRFFSLNAPRNAPQNTGQLMLWQSLWMHTRTLYLFNTFWKQGWVARGWDNLFSYIIMLLRWTYTIFFKFYFVKRVRKRTEPCCTIIIFHLWTPYLFVQVRIQYYFTTSYYYFLIRLQQKLYTYCYDNLLYNNNFIVTTQNIPVFV